MAAVAVLCLVDAGYAQYAKPKRPSIEVNLEILQSLRSSVGLAARHRTAVPRRATKAREFGRQMPTIPESRPMAAQPLPKYMPNDNMTTAAIGASGVNRNGGGYRATAPIRQQSVPRHVNVPRPKLKPLKEKPKQEFFARSEFEKWPEPIGGDVLAKRPSSDRTLDDLLASAKQQQPPDKQQYMPPQTTASAQQLAADEADISLSKAEDKAIQHLPQKPALANPLAQLKLEKLPPVKPALPENNANIVTAQKPDIQSHSDQLQQIPPDGAKPNTKELSAYERYEIVPLPSVSGIETSSSSGDMSTQQPLDKQIEPAPLTSGHRKLAPIPVMPTMRSPESIKLPPLPPLPGSPAGDDSGSYNQIVEPAPTKSDNAVGNVNIAESQQLPAPAQYVPEEQQKAAATISTPPDISAPTTTTTDSEAIWPEGLPPSARQWLQSDDTPHAIAGTEEPIPATTGDQINNRGSKGELFPKLEQIPKTPPEFIKDTITKQHIAEHDMKAAEKAMSVEIEQNGAAGTLQNSAAPTAVSQDENRLQTAEKAVPEEQQLQPTELGELVVKEVIMQPLPLQVDDIKSVPAPAARLQDNKQPNISPAAITENKISSAKKVKSGPKPKPQTIKADANKQQQQNPAYNIKPLPAQLPAEMPANKNDTINAVKSKPQPMPAQPTKPLQNITAKQQNLLNEKINNKTKEEMRPIALPKREKLVLPPDLLHEQQPEQIELPLPALQELEPIEQMPELQTLDSGTTKYQTSQEVAQYSIDNGKKADFTNQQLPTHHATQIVNNSISDADKPAASPAQQVVAQQHAVETQKQNGVIDGIVDTFSNLLVKKSPPVVPAPPAAAPELDKVPEINVDADMAPVVNSAIIEKQQVKTAVVESIKNNGDMADISPMEITKGDTASASANDNNLSIDGALPSLQLLQSEQPDMEVTTAESARPSKLPPINKLKQDDVQDINQALFGRNMRPAPDLPQVIADVNIDDHIAKAETKTAREITSEEIVNTTTDYEIVEINNKPVATKAEQEMQIASLPAAEKELVPNKSQNMVKAGAVNKLTVIYGVDDTDVPDAIKPKLEALAKKAMTENKRIEVTAYASGNADERKAANRISLSRGLSLRAFLIGVGLKEEQIIVKAKGLDNPGGAEDRADLQLK